MSRQFRDLVNTFDYKNLEVVNKKKNIMRDGIIKFKIDLCPLSCQLCSKPKGKLLWCKHIIFFILHAKNMTISEQALKI